MVTTLPTILFLVAFGPGPSVPPGWVEAKSKDDAVTFAMPAKPSERKVTQQSKTKPIDVLEYSCTSGDCLYRLEKTPVPIDMPEDKLAGALGAARDSAAKKYPVYDDKETTVGGWPAREFSIDAPIQAGGKPCRIAMLLFYADNEFYQVRVFALQPGREPKKAREFFDSVKPRKEGPIAPAAP